MKLTFVIPCYNEEKNIKLFYDAVVKSFKKSKYNIELIFVNDGSQDNTLGELKELINGTSNYEIKIIDFSRNFGKEAGIYAGLKHSTGDYAVIIDSDMQQPPHLVLDMLKVVEEDSNIDIVTYYQEKRIENKFLSHLKSKFYKIIGKLTGMKFVDGASDFRLLKRNVIEAILSLTESNRFAKGIFSWIGFNTYYIPYTPSKRAHGITKWNFKKLLMYAVSGILSFIKNPMKIILNLGIFMMLLSIILFILNIKLIMYSFILLMFGINFIVLWYISLFINRSYEESKNRPIFIAKEVITNEKDN